MVPLDAGKQDMSPFEESKSLALKSSRVKLALMLLKEVFQGINFHFDMHLYEPKGIGALHPKRPIR